MEGSDLPNDSLGIPVLVEGEVDQTVLEIINAKTTCHNFHFSECGGKSELLEEMCTVSKYIDKMGVIVDIDRSSYAEIVDQIKDKLDGTFNQVDKESDNRLIVNDRCDILVGYSGLNDDEHLDSCGIRQHEIEDHLLKILLTDDVAVERISNSNITDSSELKDAIQRFSAILEEYSVSTDSSKFIFNLVLTLLKFEGDINPFSNALFECTEVDLRTHDSTSDLVNLLDKIKGV